MLQTWERHCNPEVHQPAPLCRSPVRVHPTGAKTQTIPLPRWGIVFTSAAALTARWTDEGKDEQQGGSYEDRPINNGESVV